MTTNKYILNYEQPFEYDDDSPSGIGDHSISCRQYRAEFEVSSDKEAAKLAAKENKADLIAGIDLSAESKDVTNILLDLAQRETMNQSALFAADLVKELRREVKLLRNTHRFAGFAVLKAPDMPSVLVEVGFLSNRQDERNLLNRHYRQTLVEAIVRGVDRHFTGIEEARVY